MEERIRDIAEEIRAHSGDARRYTNICFVVSILVSILFMVFQDNELTQAYLMGSDLLLILETGCFTYWFYRSYLLWQLTGMNLKTEAEMSEWMRMHNISIKDYFHYIAGRLLPYQMILLVVFLVCAMLSDSQLHCIVISVLCIAVSFLIGYVYERYYYKKMQSRSNFPGAALLHGMFLFIVYMLNFGIMLLAAFIGYGVISDVGSAPMQEGDILVRGVGKPWMSIAFMVSAIFLVFIVTFCPPGSERLARWRKAVCMVLSVCMAASLLISIIAGRWWYEEINYTRQEIRVVHGKTQIYSFSDVTDYRWVKIDPDAPEDKEKTLVLDLSDGTMIDIMNNCAYGTGQGDYDQEAAAHWPQN